MMNNSMRGTFDLIVSSKSFESPEFFVTLDQANTNK